MDAVRAVDVGAAGRAEHRRVPLRAAAEAVRGGIVAVVRLHLDDPAADAVDVELGADELRRDLVHAAREERFDRRARAGPRAALRRGSPAPPARGRLEQPPRATAEVDDVEPALLRRVGDAVGEVERVVEDRRALGRRG